MKSPKAFGSLPIVMKSLARRRIFDHDQSAIRSAPIAVVSVVVVELTRRIDIPNVVRITSVRGTQTTVLRE